MGNGVEHIGALGFACAVGGSWVVRSATGPSACIPQLMSELEEILLQQPKGKLYHYTSASGLLGILESGALWATYQPHLNDRKESKVARSFLRREVLNAGLSPAQRRLLLRIIKEAQAPAFVLSFSEKGDLLSQWRAYCPQGDGYSIGLGPEHALFRTYAVAKSFSLVRCIYSKEEQHRLSRLLIQAFVEEFDRHDAAQLLPGEAISHTWRSFIESYQLHYLVLLMTMAFKHYGFVEEAEWRLVSQYPDMLAGAVNYRAGRFGVVPYVPISLWGDERIDKAGDARKLDHLIVGPNGNSKAARKAVELLFKTKKCELLNLGTSSTPYQ